MSDHSPAIKPFFYKLPQDYLLLEELKSEHPGIQIFDAFHNQLNELIKCRHPRGLQTAQMQEAVQNYLAGRAWEECGNWVYYPWRNSLVHILDEQDFIEVRTNRNQYKITHKERDLLQTKTIGIIGLSVGQSIALSLAMERSFGEIRIADFDHLELSNLNRIRTPLVNLDLPKVTIVAREIMELDPYLKVVPYPEGITEENLDEFLTGNGGIDLLVDECDSLDIKILAREGAKKHNIPVIMDTSDRGMIDVERFDLESDRPILHGLAGPLSADTLKGLSNKEKIPYILKMLGAEDLSPRAKASALEVGKSISTWPQLATSVFLGGAAAADISRRILLNQTVVSGRFFIDVEDIIPNRPLPSFQDHRPDHITQSMALQSIKQLSLSNAQGHKTAERSLVEQWISFAAMAPSGGNVQPWKWLLEANSVYLFHDKRRSHSFLDFKDTGSHFAFGAALENLLIASAKDGFGGNITLFPQAQNDSLIARVQWTDLKSENADDKAAFELHEALSIRVTNRKNEGRVEISQEKLRALDELLVKWPEAKLRWITDEMALNRLGEIAGEVERLRFIHPRGHHDFLNEIRWTHKEAEETKDGIDIETLELDETSKAGLSISKDPDAAHYLGEWNLGDGLRDPMRVTVQNASAVGLITISSEFHPETFIKGGRIGQQVWLKANLMNLSFQPISPSTFFFNRLLYGKEFDMNDNMKEGLQKLFVQFEELWSLERSEQMIFMFRLNRAGPPSERALRLPLEEIIL